MNQWNHEISYIHENITHFPPSHSVCSLNHFSINSSIVNVLLSSAELFSQCLLGKLLRRIPQNASQLKNSYPLIGSVLLKSSLLIYQSEMPHYSMRQLYFHCPWMSVWYANPCILLALGSLHRSFTISQLLGHLRSHKVQHSSGIHLGSHQFWIKLGYSIA